MEADILSNVWPEWHVVRKLGEGSYGCVYEAERADTAVKSSAAIKVISIPQTEVELASLMSEGMTAENARMYYRGLVDDFIGEIMIMESLKGVQNIVSVEDYKVVEKPGRIGWDIYIRMELLTPFNDYLLNHRMTEMEIIDLGIDICTALERCAKLHVIHRDIKPENIFINNFGDFKLGDFGIARRLENTSSGMSIKGTYNYMAPEIYRGEEYDQTVDTYSLGLVLYRLANDNRLPFLSSSDQMNPNARVAAAQKRLSGEPIPAPCNASFDLAQIIGIACQPDPKDRFGSATAMKNSLRSLKNELTNRNAAVPAWVQDPDRTVSVRKAAVTPVPPVSAQVPPANIPNGKNPPPPKKSRAGLIIAIAAAATVTIVLIALAVIFLPQLIDGKDGDKKTEEPTKTVTQTETTKPSLGEATTASQPAETTAPETATPETTTQPPKEYTIGEIITFGHYEQDANTENGKEEVEWIVLDVQEDRILVISRLGLDGQMYDTSGRDNVTWENCSLRYWLNNNFLNSAFSPDEQSQIIESLVSADSNPKYPDKNPGNDTWDKVFLLSTNEAEYYFSSDKYRIVQPTSYAIKNGVTYCDNDNNQGRGYWWWLRTPGDVRTDTDGNYGQKGKKYNAATLVYPEGKIDYQGSWYFDTENAVRPAMWIAR